MSADTVKSQNNFCNKQNFPFQLLSDTEKTTLRAYEAIGMKKMYGREYEGIFRISYLIDEKEVSTVLTIVHHKRTLTQIVLMF